MLSEKIDTLKDTLGVYRAGGMVLRSEAVCIICKLLGDLAAEARQLEQSIVPGLARLTGHDLPENVVPISHLMTKRGLVSIPGNGGPGSDGGDAA